MTSALEQSIKERIRTLAKERDISFSQLWTNLILERFLARLCQSSYRDHFVFKGGSLLAKYLPLGRETKDLDFFVQELSNTKATLMKSLTAICSIDLDDSFIFILENIEPLDHVHMPYSGSQISLMAQFGGTKTHVRIDLGFGDIVDAIDHRINLIATIPKNLFLQRN